MMSFLALVLQVQCGFQTIGAVTLSYGNVVYVTPDEQNTPKVAFFKIYQDQSQSHSYCNPLKQSLFDGKAVLLKVDETKDEVIEIQFPK